MVITLEIAMPVFHPRLGRVGAHFWQSNAPKYNSLLGKQPFSMAAFGQNLCALD